MFNQLTPHHMTIVTQIRFFIFLGLALFVLANPMSFAADAIPLVYRLRADTQLQECDASGNKAGMLLRTAPADAHFTIIKTQKDADGNYLIQFAEWEPLNSVPKNLLTTGSNNFTASGQAVTVDENNAPLTPQKIRESVDYSYYFNFNYDPSTGLDRYFLISQAQLDARANILAARFTPTAGAVVMPFKFRSQSGDFTKDITISGMGGISWHPGRRTEHALSLLFGVGITSVTLTPRNSLVTENRDQAAITPSLCLLYQWERLQIGALLGTDILGEDNPSWRYNKKHWLAMGIGFSIFKPEDTAAKDAGDNGSQAKR